MDQPNTPIKVNYKENLRIILALFLPSALGLIIYSMFFLTIIVFEQNSEFKKLLQTISVNNFKGTFLDGTINSISKLLSIFFSLINIILFNSQVKLILRIGFNPNPSSTIELTAWYSMFSFFKS